MAKGMSDAELKDYLKRNAEYSKEIKDFDKKMGEMAKKGRK